MPRTKLILCVVAASCLHSSSVYSQGPGGRFTRSEASRLQQIEAEIVIETHELEAKSSELAVDEAKVELEKIKLHVEAAQEEGSSREVTHAKLELKQAAIRVQMREVQAKMARLQVERAKAGFEQMRATTTGKAVPSLEVKIFSIANGNVHELAAAIRELFPDDEENPMYLAIDPRTKSVIARGAASDLDVVEAILLKLDRD